MPYKSREDRRKYTRKYMKGYMPRYRKEEKQLARLGLAFLKHNEEMIKKLQRDLRLNELIYGKGPVRRRKKEK